MTVKGRSKVFVFMFTVTFLLVLMPGNQEVYPPLQGLDEEQPIPLPAADPTFVCYSTAANITAEAILYVMRNIRPSIDTEMSVADMLGDYFVSKRVPWLPCYDAQHIVAVNANALNHENNPAWKNQTAFIGDLLLVDTGARYIYACSDVTRTFPVGRKFKTNTQRLYYHIALCTLKLGENLAHRNVGNMSLENIQGKMYEYLDRFHMRKYATWPIGHGMVHYIGAGDDQHGDRTGWKTNLSIQPGQYFALEVGLYFPDEGIGIRIEDTYAARANGIIRLSAKCPREMSEIEIIQSSSLSQ